MIRFENLSTFRKESISDTSTLKINIMKLGKIGIVNIINSTVSPNQNVQLPSWFNVREFFVASIYSKEESLGAEIGLAGNTLTFYPLKTLSEITGQIVVFLN